MKRFAPRLHVLLASDTPIGLVIRRGPAKRTATILWNRDTDGFQLGQSALGRIYERYSDLSPDGKYLLYSSLKYSREGEIIPYGQSTVISHAP